MALAQDRDCIRGAFADRHILVCGASGNLGGHLVLKLASLGARLTLWGRRADILDRLVADCQSAGSSKVDTRFVDLSDIGVALAALREADDLDPFDAAFLVSGAGDTREAGRLFESAELVARLGLVNYVGPITLAAELGERMAIRGGGRIVLVGSAAATHPLPFAAGYVSSKSGLSMFADALRLAVKPYGVNVTLASPGFFAPPHGQAHGYVRPGEIAAEAVASRLIDAVAAGRSEVVTPLWFVGLRWLGRALPRLLRDRLLLSIPIP